MYYLYTCISLSQKLYSYLFIKNKIVRIRKLFVLDQTNMPNHCSKRICLHSGNTSGNTTVLATTIMV